MQLSKDRWKNNNNLLVFSAIAVLVALLLRNSGLYPVVLNDEYLYSKFSRLLPLTESPIPNYIYLAIYRLTNVCGEGFLNCARTLNAIFFVAATPFIYMTATRVSSKSVASVVALLALLGPINRYTAFYMPEALYFFSFWVLTWYMLRLNHLSTLRSWIWGGALCGLSALIKPHTLFFLPALLLYILYISRQIGNGWVWQAFQTGGVFLAATFGIKLVIGYLFAGEVGATILGLRYVSVASSGLSNFQHYVDVFTLSSESVKGHLMALCLMFGCPIAIAISLTARSLFSNETIASDQKLSFYTLAILANMILVTGLFSALVADAAQYESIARVHMRYYNFALPLMLIVASSQLFSTSVGASITSRATIGLIIAAVNIYSFGGGMTHYTPRIADSPELMGFTFYPAVFYVLSGISISTIGLWVYSARLGAGAFLFFLMPLAVIFTSYVIDRELGVRRQSNVFDKAGIITKQYLADTDLSKVVVVGSDFAGLYRSLFHIDNSEASLEVIPKGSAYDLAKVPEGKEWVLLIGRHSLVGDALYQLPMHDFTLVRTFGSNIIDFSKSAWPGIISSARGLSGAEVFGAWSSGNAVILEFVFPLPEKFRLHLVAHAFGPNVGEDFVALVGDSAIRFTLGPSPEERVLEFSNPKRSNTLNIEIPLPTSPKELGMSSDGRSLGIALKELWITPL